MKALLGGELSHDPVDRSLEGWGRSHVDHPSAAGTEQMMMVLGQIFGQLEPGELVTGGDAPDDPRALEVDEVPVGRAPRHLGQLRCDVRDADGVAVRGQELDDGSPARRIALVDTLQADLDQVAVSRTFPSIIAGIPTGSIAPPTTPVSHSVLTYSLRGAPGCERMSDYDQKASCARGQAVDREGAL